MKNIFSLEKKRILIVGLARSGVAATKFCAARSARVSISEALPLEKVRSAYDEVKDLAVSVELGGHQEKTFLAQDLIVVSPGVPLSIPPVVAARNAGIEIISELELASRFLKGRVVAVTGSNGKTTTTTLMGEIMREAGFDTRVGGNIGTPLTALVEHATDETVFVVEASSFQLEAIPTFAPTVGVVLNVTPDHMDRYASFEEYISFKVALFQNQKKSGWAVLNLDDPVTAKFVGRIHGRVLGFSRRRALEEGVYLEGTTLVAAGKGKRVAIMKRDEIPLRGDHNVENCLAALAVAQIFGVNGQKAADTIRHFQGVEHRLEHVATFQGVQFYNDSKATNVDATIKALEAFPQNILLILGGKDKGGDFSLLGSLVRERVKRIFLIGAAAEKIGSALSQAAPVVQSGDLPTAVQEAFRTAEPGDVVLLAPACASFDQFENYEHRGRVFKACVQELVQSAVRP